jgi:hypothetical protein
MGFFQVFHTQSIFLCCNLSSTWKIWPFEVHHVDMAKKTWVRRGLINWKYSLCVHILQFYQFFIYVNIMYLKRTHSSCKTGIITEKSTLKLKSLKKKTNHKLPLATENSYFFKNFDSHSPEEKMNFKNIFCLFVMFLQSPSYNLNT